MDMYLKLIGRLLVLLSLLPLQVIFPKRFSLFQSLNIGNGDICIYDLAQTKKGPVHILRNEDEVPRAAVAIKFNKNQKDLLACGFAGGQIKIFQLAQNLCEPGNEELDTLNSILSTVQQ